jgi:hypothetical protein
MTVTAVAHFQSSFRVNRQPPMQPGLGQVQSREERDADRHAEGKVRLGNGEAGVAGKIHHRKGKGSQERRVGDR